VVLPAWPLTPNGKLDRRALPEPGGDAFVTRAWEAPAGETETAVAQIWADVLGVERVGRRDHFFELGGHSLRAVMVVSRIRQALGVQASLGELFTSPVLADFARGLKEQTGEVLPAIEPVSREGRLELSFAQQRLWFLDRMGTSDRAYNVPLGLRLKGSVDRDALGRTLDRIVARHEALRTVFALEDGEPVQRIRSADESRFGLIDHDLSGEVDADAALRRMMADEANTAFDLETGPVVRGRLIRMAGDDHVLLITLHHIASDGWSVDVLVNELSVLYAAFAAGRPDPLPELPVQYADYAAWQRRWLDRDVLQTQVDYWKRALAGAPELLELPTDRPRPAEQDFTGAVAGVRFDAELSASLKALSRRHGTTLFMTMLAGWAATLARLSGQTDVVVGTPSANRGQRETEGLIGFFVNTLALRVDLGGSPTVAQLLARVREQALAAQEHGDIPFDRVVELVQPVRSLSHGPLFQVAFAWQNTPGGTLELPGLTLSSVGSSSSISAKYDLSLTLQETDAGIMGDVTYPTALFDRATVERWMGYLRNVLAAMAADDGQPVDRLPLLPHAERVQVVETWNRPQAMDDAPAACVHTLFEAQAERRPDALAVVYDGERLSYAQLNARANRLAHHLIGLGVGPDARVGICMERGTEMAVGLLAVVKAGGCYVPLDPDYPADRLRHMVEDSAPAALLAFGVSDALVAGLLGESQSPVIRFETDAHAWAELPDTNPARGGVRADHLVYVIYTSGSTGRPKGVMNHHGCLVNRVVWGSRAWALTADDALLCKTSLSFDGHIRETFLPWSVGAPVVMARPGGHRDPDYLLDVIRARGVTMVNLNASMLLVLLENP
ncbi:MAG TPA: condensation domain-containing protein, partial [Longimicrobium sp.]|nr:condensation domain-containing protein [Longimicrobium sp.]